MTKEPIPRWIPAIVTFLSPFRIVSRDNMDPWLCTIEDVNKQTWNYVQLHEIMGQIDVGLPAPYNLVICRDGALALPPVPEFRNDQRVVEFFNRCLAGLLLGGVFCQSISLDYLQFGSVIDWKYLRTQSAHSGRDGDFHDRIRRKHASASEAIRLYRPRTIDFNELSKAMDIGLSVLRNVKELSGEFLLKGVTGIARRDWGTGLSNLWIVAEQLTQHLWEREVLGPERLEVPRVPGRKNQLSDYRTWPISAKHELLFQKSILGIELLTNLSNARKARNDLSHAGKHPTADNGRAVLESVKGLLAAVLKQADLPMFSLNFDDHSLSDPFKLRDMKVGEPEFWMEIPKLPGEAELEREEALLRKSEK